MLKVNVGLSKKLTQDYNSTGFSINVEGEVAAPLGDAEAVVSGIRELYDLAEEALDVQIGRAQSESALASHDELPGRRFQTPQYRQNGNGSNGHEAGLAKRSNNGRSQQPEPATQKQINYLLSIGKRSQLSTLQLEQQIEGILGEQIGIYDLTKQEAARAIDALASATTPSSRR